MQEGYDGRRIGEGWMEHSKGFPPKGFFVDKFDYI